MLGFLAFIVVIAYIACVFTKKRTGETDDSYANRVSDRAVNILLGLIISASLLFLIIALAI